MSIPKSIKTRLLSASYKAACAVAERVFALTEHLRVQKEDSYQDDLFNYRDKLAEELAEGQGLIVALAAQNDALQAELDFAHREIYGPDFPTGVWKDYTEREQVPEGAGVRDFDDLPAPQGVNEDEAPEGYKAVPYDSETNGCADCAFSPDNAFCPTRDGELRCIDVLRADRTEVIFVKR